jgi:transcriptional antiterminator
MYLDRVPVEKIAEQLGVSLDTIQKDIAKAKDLLVIGAGEKMMKIASDAIAERYKLIREQWKEIDKIESSSLDREAKSRLKTEVFKTLQKTIEGLEEISGIKAAQKQQVQQNLNQVIIEPKEASRKIFEMWSQSSISNSQPSSLPPPAQEESIFIQDDIIDVNKID